MAEEQEMESHSEDEKDRLFGRLSDPFSIAVLSGGLALLGVLVGNRFQESTSQHLADRQFEADADMAEQEFQTNLILRALEAGTQEERLDALRFLQESGLLNDGAIRNDIDAYLDRDLACLAQLPQFGNSSSEAAAIDPVWLDEGLSTEDEEEQPYKVGCVAVIGGTSYPHSVAMDSTCEDGTSFTYRLGQQYATLSFTAGLSDSSSRGSSGSIIVQLDGREVTDVDLASGRGEQVQLDVNGGETLLIEGALADCENAGSSGSVVVGSPLLSKVPLGGVNIDSQFVCIRIDVDPLILMGTPGAGRDHHLTELQAELEELLTQHGLKDRRAGIVLSFGTSDEPLAGRALAEAFNLEVLSRLSDTFSTPDGRPVASRGFWDGMGIPASVMLNIYPVIDSQNPPLPPESSQMC